MGLSVGPNTLKLRRKKKGGHTGCWTGKRGRWSQRGSDETACGDSPRFKQKTLQIEKRRQRDENANRDVPEVQRVLLEGEQAVCASGRPEGSTGHAGESNAEHRMRRMPSPNAWEQFDRLRTTGVWSQKATTVVP